MKQFWFQVGINIALDLSYERTKASLQPYVMDEIRGIADALGKSVDSVRRIMWLGEVTPLSLPYIQKLHLSRISANLHLSIIQRASFYLKSNFVRETSS